ncbi:MAG: LytR/AlgR family response regulator transcription factor [Coprococcus sp.]
MIAITVDDERPMLKMLTAAVSSSPDINSIAEFSSCSSALEWVENNPVDIAFLDISMRGMGGLALAERIVEARPECKIIFCTGFAQYAVDAFRLHVSGYLIKPITAEAVQKEIDYIKGIKEGEKLLTVKCFGNFEAFSHGEVLSFKRSKSKELLAILIDRNGSGMIAKQICAILWPDRTDNSKNMNYLHQLFIDLRNALETVGAEEILRQNGYSYFVDTERIDCDYYSFLQTGKPEFHGEYMTQYSWAEETCALMWQK